MTQVLVLDVETEVVWREDGSGSIDGSPYNPRNSLVSCGYGWVKDGTYHKGNYLFFKHDTDGPKDKFQAAVRHDELQLALRNADLVVGHNLKFDMSWLLESGFTCDAPWHCTQVAEYLLLRGQKTRGLSLEAVAEHYNVTKKRKALVDEQFKQKVQYSAMNADVVQMYGEADVQSCAEVYISQVKEYAKPESKGMVAIRDLAFEFCTTLTDIERNGNFVDADALAKVNSDYLSERLELETRLQELVAETMGARPINLASPEQLSCVIYSRRVKDKNVWKDLFNIGVDDKGKPLRKPKMSPKDFGTVVKEQTEKLFKQTAHHCQTCQGSGKIRKIKKDGSEFKKDNICGVCKGAGYTYEDTGIVAGLKLSPRSPEDAASGGFGTDKATLNLLVYRAKAAGNAVAAEFLEKSIRLSAVESYLSNFVGGIRRNLQDDGLIHPKLNQTITATQRLSSSEPNFQNMPRAKTFPIRAVVKSRFPGGSIIEADYAALEFRIAGDLSNDPVIFHMVANGIDAHLKTGSIIFQKDMSEVTKDQRQDSKAHSFAPLFGSTGANYPDHIRRYYEEFTKTYPGIGRWHKDLQEEAIRTKKLVLPDGKEFSFPHCKRGSNGNASGATMIKNYPVQYTATGLIVPLAIVRLHKLFKLHNVKSLIINTVHDSGVIDRHPDDSLALLTKLIVEAGLGIKAELKSRFGYGMKIPLAIEIKTGPNWLEGDVLGMYTEKDLEVV